MRAYVFTNFLGVFVFDSQNNLLEFKLFPKDPEKTAKILMSKNPFLKEIEKDFKPVREIDSINFDFCKFALEKGIFRSEKEFYSFLQRTAQIYTKMKIEKSLSEDLYLVELIKLQTELESSINPLKERLTSLKNVKETSYLIRKFEFKIKDLQDFYEEVEKEVSNLSQKIMPNVSYILGENLAAQLLALAGSMEKLARMPSSTIQVLGAEKALFRHMKGQGKSPKHGILFLHPNVNSLKKEQRGAMARFIANKLSILVKVDFYGGEFIADKIKKQIEEKYEKLKNE